MARGSVHGGGSLSGGSSRGSSGGSFRGSHSSNSGGRLPNGMGHGYGYRRPPRHYHWFGRTVVVTSGTGAFFSVIIMLLVFASIFLATVIWDKQDQEAAVSLYAYHGKTYEEVCEKANNGESGYYIFEFSNIDSEQLAHGSWVDSKNPLNTLNVYEDETFTYNGIILYRIEYSFRISGRTITETTYSTYTASDIRSMHSFKVAYTGEDFVTSINVDYKLNENLEYLYELDNLNSQKTVVTVMIVIVSGLGAVLIIGVVAKILKSKKASETATVSDNEENAKPINTPSAEEKSRYCPYCGSIVEDNKTRCSSCGAKIRK